MPPPNRKKRRSERGQSSNRLAVALLQKQNVVFVTGAGLSVASGVRPFRGSGGIWKEVFWKTATRSCFRKDPLEWYNGFWLPHFADTHLVNMKPNAGHAALQTLKELFPESCHVITQNIDGLQRGVLEAHGRVGLYKCIPDEDSDTDSDSDEDDDRPVHLGHRRKCRALRERIRNEEDQQQGETENTIASLSVPQVCRYQLLESIRLDQLEPPSVRLALQRGDTELIEPPRCPACNRPVPPQALLFDEGYHSHDFYQFQEMETLLAKAQVMVFVGTSFNVNITTVALDHAREAGIPVFNFNTQDVLEPSVRLNVNNIMGKSDETLPLLLQQVKELMADSSHS